MTANDLDQHSQQDTEIPGPDEDAKDVADVAAVLTSGATEILSDSARAERDRLLIFALLGLAMSTVASPISDHATDAHAMSFELLGLKLTIGNAAFHYGLTFLVFYFSVTFGMLALQDRKRWKVAITLKWLPLDNKISKLTAEMLAHRNQQKELQERMRSASLVEREKKETQKRIRRDSQSDIDRALQEGDLEEVSRLSTMLQELEHQWRESTLDLRPMAAEIQGLAEQITTKNQATLQLQAPMLASRRSWLLQNTVSVVSPLIFSTLAMIALLATAQR
jgi:hypothetical protein